MGDLLLSQMILEKMISAQYNFFQIFKTILKLRLTIFVVDCG